LILTVHIRAIRVLHKNTAALSAILSDLCGNKMVSLPKQAGVKRLSV
jgi:hypothetical protein